MDDLGCLCKKCFNALVGIIEEQNSDVVLMLDKASVSHNTPEVEVPYENEKGNRYWRSVSASANYCCECGTEI